MRSLRVVLSIVLGAFGCRGKSSSEAAPVASVAPAETVTRTLPLELGEGDDRDLKVPVWPIAGGQLELPSGTKVEQLRDDASKPVPAAAPTDAPRASYRRVRVTAGPHSGLVGYVRNTYVQGAR